MKTISKSQFRIGIFLFLSYSFGIETINVFIHSCSWSLENHTRIQTKMSKVYTRFQTKTAKTVPFGRHIPIPIWLIKGSTPPPYPTRTRTTPFLQNSDIPMVWDFPDTWKLSLRFPVAGWSVVKSHIPVKKKKIGKNQLAERYADCSSILKMFRI